jgi:GNAT superfamily N-acetyltransferase
MTKRAALNISLLHAKQADDTKLMAEVEALINDVYAVAEEGLWKDGVARTNLNETTDLTRSGEIAVAYLDGRLVGCIRVQQLEDEVYEFGMLAASREHRGMGVGRELVQFVERYARESGCNAVQLEVLVPSEWSHPSKKFLIEWYTRIGYEPKKKGSLAEYYPDLEPLLATPCNYLIFRKDIRA